MRKFQQYTPVFFVLIVFSFLLPCINIYFNGSPSGSQKVGSLTGLQLVIKDGYRISDDIKYNYLGYKTPEQEEAYARSHGLDYWGSVLPSYPNNNTFAILTLLISFLCLVISFMKVIYKRLLLLTISIAGCVMLFLLQNSLNKEILRFLNGKFSIDYGFGFWFAVLLFVASAIVQVIFYNEEKKVNAEQK